MSHDPQKDEVSAMTHPHQSNSHGTPGWLVQGHWPSDDGPIYRTANERDARDLAATLTAAGAHDVTITGPAAARPRRHAGVPIRPAGPEHPAPRPRRRSSS